MNYGKTIFAQLMDFLPVHEFRQCVERYQGHYKIKSLTCWDQFLCMAFAQLTYRESLRDIQACLRGSQQKLARYILSYDGETKTKMLVRTKSPYADCRYEPAFNSKVGGPKS